MRIIETIYDYRYEPNEIVSYLKNRLMKVFWRHNTAKDSLAYYVINREISDRINENVETLNCEFKIDSRYYREINENKDYVIDRLSRQIAESLVNNNKVVIIKRQDPQFVTFRASIPFLKIDYDELREDE